jgi:hypothetical protein
VRQLEPFGAGGASLGTMRVLRQATLLLLATGVAAAAGCDQDCYDPKHPPASIASSYGHEGCPCEGTGQAPVCVHGAAETFALICDGERWKATATEACHP